MSKDCSPLRAKPCALALLTALALSACPTSSHADPLPTKAIQWDRKMHAGLVVGNVGGVLAIGTGIPAIISLPPRIGFIGVGPGGHHQLVVGHFVATDALIRTRLALGHRGLDLSQSHEAWALGLTLGGMASAWMGLSLGLNIGYVETIAPSMGVLGLLMSTAAIIPLELGRQRAREAWLSISDDRAWPRLTSRRPAVRVTPVVVGLGFGLSGEF